MNILEKIVGNRICIRPFGQNDFTAFHSFMTNKQSTQYLLFDEGQKTETGIQSLFDYTLASYSSDMNIASLAIANRENDCYIGSVGFAPDFTEGNIQVYWSVNKEYEGMGYATEAMGLLIAQLKKQFSGTVRAYCHPNNVASEKVAFKLGMTDMGTVYIEPIGQNSRMFQLII